MIGVRCLASSLVNWPPGKTTASDWKPNALTASGLRPQFLQSFPLRCPSRQAQCPDRSKMGNALRRASDDPIDGGSVRRISGDRSTSSPIEYDPRLVKKLILARRMAPFYEGKAEAEEGSTTRESPPSSPASASSLELATDPAESPLPNKKRRHRRIFSRSRKDKRPADGLSADPAVRQLLNAYQTECPICFLVSYSVVGHTTDTHGCPFTPPPHILLIGQLW